MGLSKLPALSFLSLITSTFKFGVRYISRLPVPSTAVSRHVKGTCTPLTPQLSRHGSPKIYFFSHHDLVLLLSPVLVPLPSSTKAVASVENTLATKITCTTQTRNQRFPQRNQRGQSIRIRKNERPQWQEI